MGHRPPDRIRNVALIGHRGSGKTSLAEALLFEAGIVNRLGSVQDGSTVLDFEDDERDRQRRLPSGHTLPVRHAGSGPDRGDDGESADVRDRVRGDVQR